MRLIDADALPYENQVMSYDDEWCLKVSDIDKAPTIDAVEVVRCSKCKYGGIDDPDFPNQYICHYYGNGLNNGEYFCAYGERKE